MAVLSAPQLSLSHSSPSFSAAFINSWREQTFLSWTEIILIQVFS